AKPAAPRFRPTVENLERREVPALVASEMVHLGAVEGVSQFILRRTSPSVVLVIRPGAVGGVSQSTCPEDNVDDCVQAFLRLGPLVTSGAPRLHGQGQLKYWVCHDTNSATNPMVLINVAAPAAFGAHLRLGDTVFIRRTPG